MKTPTVVSTEPHTYRTKTVSPSAFTIYHVVYNKQKTYVTLEGKYFAAI
jgi:hypothetical protein